jgi:hypothetical protein
LIVAIVKNIHAINTNIIGTLKENDINMYSVNKIISTIFCERIFLGIIFEKKFIEK